jgi:2,3-bisphosphoglycerate-independent phosphoglycerate mutase
VSDFAPRPKPVVLLILDGWGHREDPTDNAVAQATLPNWRRLLKTCPNTLRAGMWACRTGRWATRKWAT